MATFCEHKTERPPKLQARYQIGSKIAPMNYPSNQKCFHANDTPAHKQEAKKFIKNSLKSQILSTSKPNWNTATSTGEAICSRRTYVNSAMNRSNMYVYNYRAEKLPSSYPMMKHKSNKFNQGILEVRLQHVRGGDNDFSDERIKNGISRQLEELPNHPKLLGKERWCISSDIKDPIHHEKFIQAERNRHNNSQKWHKKVQKSYVKPQDAYKQRRTQSRAEKMAAYKKKHASYSDLLPSAGLYDKLEAERVAKDQQNEEVEPDP